MLWTSSMEVLRMEETLVHLHNKIREALSILSVTTIQYLSSSQYSNNRKQRNLNLFQTQCSCHKWIHSKCNNKCMVVTALCRTLEWAWVEECNRTGATSNKTWVIIRIWVVASTQCRIMAWVEAWMVNNSNTDSNPCNSSNKTMEDSNRMNSEEVILMQEWEVVMTNSMEDSDKASQVADRIHSMYMVKIIIDKYLIWVQLILTLIHKKCIKY